MTCASFLQSFADWLKGKASDEDRYLDLILVSNDKAGPARYAEGQLRLKTYPPNTAPFPSGDSFVGAATLYESHERWSEPRPADWPDNVFWVPPTSPFSPKTTDQIRIQIHVPTGRVMLTSGIKGKAIIENPQCADFLLFGFATEGSGALGVGGSKQLTPVVSQAPSGGGHFPGIPTTNPIQPIALVRPYYVISFHKVSVAIPH